MSDVGKARGLWWLGAIFRAVLLLALVGLELIFGWWGVAGGVLMVVLVWAWRSHAGAGNAAADGSDAVQLVYRVNRHAIADGVLDPSGVGVWPYYLRGIMLIAMGVCILGVGLVYLPGGFVFLALTPMVAGLEHLARGMSLGNATPAPVGMEVRREGGAYVVCGRDGQVGVGKEAAQLRDGRAEVAVQVVRRFRLPRWIFEQSTIILPLVISAVSVLAMQLALLALLFQMMFPGSGPTEPEPSAEYLQRLLTGDHRGEEQGYITLERKVKPSETKIESYYLPGGSAGPVTDVGGGAQVGSKPRSADPRTEKAKPDVAIQIEEFGKTEALAPQDAPPEPSIDDLADPLATADGVQEGQRQSVEVKEGWGLTDWYDTEDARADAKEIQDQLDLSRRLLRLDPDNMVGLSVKAYYEYLAMDFDAAKATYDHMIRLDGTSGAEWNNLALIYKRLGAYEKEEELYRTSLMFDPDEPNTYVNLALCLARQGRFGEALQIMKRLERELPDDPYADLHRAKIAALMGKEEEAYRLLRESLRTMRKLDTLHNIEFQQDIRVDPAFQTMRETPRFKKLLMRYYGDRPGGWWILGKKE
ncbi:MAG: tetratricopeptide repeat protein [Myxococcales bacterium]|nr:tetratricopeptide repeat protein [Myxococcales bacterium]